MTDTRLYHATDEPFGEPWNRWAAKWCRWMLSIPKDKNPSIDSTGKNCSSQQLDENVWFLTGSFGNIRRINRRCTIPLGRSIFFPIMEKEDSLAEDTDLTSDLGLIERCVDSMNQVFYLEASIDGSKVPQLENYRVRSDVFDLKFPRDNVYGVRPGLTRSVCDGYWLFIKPLPIGKHKIEFIGECTLADGEEVKKQLRSDVAYKQIWNHIDSKSTFRLNVCYDLTIAE